MLWSHNEQVASESTNSFQHSAYNGEWTHTLHFDNNFLRSFLRYRNVTFFNLARSQRANFCKTWLFFISSCICSASFPLCCLLSFTACHSRTLIKAFHFTSGSWSCLKTFLIYFVSQEEEWGPGASSCNYGWD